MFDTIKNLWNKSVEAATGHFKEDIQLDYDADLMKKLAEGYETEMGFEKEEAEEMATQVAMSMSLAMGFSGATASTKASGAAKKAFGRVVRDPQARAISAKAMAKIKELETKIGAKVKGDPKTFFQKLSAQPVINYLLFGMIMTQMDFNLWSTDKVASALDWVGLGNAYRSIFYKSIGLTFSNSQVEEIVKGLHNTGYRNLFDFDTNERLDLTPTNMRYILEKGRLRLVASGRKFNLDDQRAQAVSRARKEATYTEEAAPEAGPEKPAFTQVKIAGIPFGQILIPPVILERITNVTELGDVARKSAVDYVNSIPERISFEIRRVTHWITATGQVLRANPPMFQTREVKNGTETTRTVKNRIVVIDIYLTNHQNKRVKVFTIPLDYSLADNVLTPAPLGLETPTKIVVELKKVILPSPPEAAIAATPSVAAEPTYENETANEIIRRTTPKPKPYYTAPVVPPQPEPPPPPPAPTHKLRRFQDVNICCTDGMGLRMRSKPNLKGSILRTYPDDSPGQVWDLAGEADGYHWVKVRMSDGRIGYMAERYLR